MMGLRSPKYRKIRRAPPSEGRLKGHCFRATHMLSPNRISAMES